MLLKKIFYGYSRVRYVICEQEPDGSVTFEFCRWFPLGSRNGRSQYFSKVYNRKTMNNFRAPRVLRKLSRMGLSIRMLFSYSGEWGATFYSPEIKQIVWKILLDNLFLIWLFYLALVGIFGE